ncbi:MAG: hypothetical protein V7K48_16690 [Nostoc sp.]|uniref:hypothetical protein n=1 Tax=Nostoc sp. TaxID=1180 RepID=UPI002FF50893
MPKRIISSKLVDARSLAIYQLDNFVNYVQSIDPELNLDEATQVAAIALHHLPTLFVDNPELVERLKERAATVKSQSRRKARRSMN